MEDKPFDRPVRIVTGPSGNIVRTVDSAIQAADYLLHRWPTEGGKKHLAARRACMAVLEGVKQARVARKAFEEAAHEAEILVGQSEGNPLAGALKPRR